VSNSFLYLAGPLFNDSERNLGRELASILVDRFEVYLPPQHGFLLPDLIANGTSPEKARRQIFSADIEAINRCTVIFVILNGRTIDEGAAFELGVAWSLGKTCIGYKDDFRQLTSSGDNPMIEGALSMILTNYNEVRAWLTTLK
jgi:nucleoside 2-deoxyribosyltransferase